MRGTALNAVMCSRGLRIARQLFAEFSCKQPPLADLLARRVQIRGNGAIRVEGPQRFIIERLRQRMQAVQPVRPAADDHDTIKPRIECIDQASEIIKF